MKVKMRCQGCGGQGPVTLGSPSRPSWCGCVGSYGPIVAAPATVIMIRFEGREDAAFRERCRLLSNAERIARDALSGCYIRCGAGFRELPKSSPKRRRLYAAYHATLAALESVQAECRHDEDDRCPYNREACGVCNAHVVTDVAQHRHLVREGFYAAEERAS